MSGLIQEIDKYYTQKLKEFGATAKGVDWNSDESQHLRFEKLLAVIGPPREFFSVLDYGCGFGSLYHEIENRFPDFQYTGFDISSSMIREAKKTIHSRRADWISVLPENKKFDYVLASGIFNVRLDNTNETWLDYIHDVLHNINASSLKGFSFNSLSIYSDSEKRKDHLYYADPAFWFNYCKKNISDKVALLHNYPLYEFTILVNK